MKVVYSLKQALEIAKKVSDELSGLDFTSLETDDFSQGMIGGLTISIENALDELINFLETVIECETKEVDDEEDGQKRN